MASEGRASIVRGVPRGLQVELRVEDVVAQIRDHDALQRGAEVAQHVQEQVMREGRGGVTPWSAMAIPFASNGPIASASGRRSRLP